MLGLVVAIIFSLEVAYFASQNSAGVPLRFINYAWNGVPLYVVVVASVLIGVLISWFISAVNSASYFMKARSKDGIIQKDRKEIQEMKQRLHLLEIENQKLKSDNKIIATENVDRNNYGEDVEEKPSVLERIFPSSSKHYAKQI